MAAMRIPSLSSWLLILPLAFSPLAATAAERPPEDWLRAAAGGIALFPGAHDQTLSPTQTHADIRRALRKVADWQLQQASSRWTQDWTYVPLYLGLLATSQAIGEPRYHDAVLEAARGFGWQMLPGRDEHADDLALAAVYAALYRENTEPLRLAETERRLQVLLARPDRPGLWWWCDALFMAPPPMAMLAAIRDDRRYLAFADREWQRTRAALYDEHQRLYYRDARYRTQHEANGQPLFWSRGNGWVLAGTLRWLRALPPDDPLRPRYQQQFREMAERIAALQPADGLWRMGLLDPDAYPMGEVSGTALFTFALAGGIRDGLLDATHYQPVVERAWAGLLRNIYADGRLGAIQPIGSAPDALRAASSWVFGVGAFLMAGAELDALAAR